MEIETAREEDTAETSNEQPDDALNVEGTSGTVDFSFFVKFNIQNSYPPEKQRQHGNTEQNDRQAKNWTRIGDSSLFITIYVDWRKREYGCRPPPRHDAVVSVYF